MCASFDPFDINDCRDAPRIHARLDILKRMASYAFDSNQRIRETEKELKRRLAALGEE